VSAVALTAIHPADRELLEQILRESGVGREVSEASWGSYIAHLAERIAGGVFRWTMSGVSALLDASGFWGWVIWALLALAGAALVVWLLRFVLDAFRAGRRRAVTEPEDLALEAGARAHAVAAAAWRRRLAEHLAAGRIPEALEAVWWWLARSIAAERADPAWTSRELVARAGRPELAPAVATLDVLLYGPRRPAVPEVEAFVHTLEGRLGG